MRELWKKIDGFDGYEISNFGRVRSSRIWGKSTTPPKFSRTMKPGTHPKGYQNVLLRKNGKSLCRKIHVLVLEGFVCKRPKDHEVSHKDGNPKNNNLNNLVWATAKINSHQKFLHGTMPCKINESIVKKIRDDFKLGIQQTSLAKKYKISSSNISLIVRNLTWSHVK